MMKFQPRGGPSSNIGAVTTGSPPSWVNPVQAQVVATYAHTGAVLPWSRLGRWSCLRQHHPGALRTSAGGCSCWPGAFLQGTSDLGRMV